MNKYFLSILIFGNIFADRENAVFDLSANSVEFGDEILVKLRMKNSNLDAVVSSQVPSMPHSSAIGFHGVAKGEVIYQISIKCTNLGWNEIPSFGFSFDNIFYKSSRTNYFVASNEFYLAAKIDLWPDSSWSLMDPPADAGASKTKFHLEKNILRRSVVIGMTNILLVDSRVNLLNKFRFKGNSSYYCSDPLPISNYLVRSGIQVIFPLVYYQIVFFRDGDYEISEDNFVFFDCRIRLLNRIKVNCL